MPTQTKAHNINTTEKKQIDKQISGMQLNGDVEGPVLKGLRPTRHGHC